VGPQLSSTLDQDGMTSSIPYNGPKLDVVIPAFSPGLSKDEANYEKEGIWPELRRAEANRFAYKLKQALDDTGKFGAVRVTPDSTASGDLYVLGTIDESNGIDVKFDLNVIDASNKSWFDDTIKYEVTEGFYKNPNNADKDAYDPAFELAAARIVEALLKQQTAELTKVKQIAELRFGASFNDKAFMPYLDTSKKPITLVGFPSANDPLYKQVNSIRVREQLFVDDMQSNYSDFSKQMEESYLLWQKGSFTELKLQQAAQMESILKIVGGILLVVGGIAAGNSGDIRDNNTGNDIAAIAGTLGGAALISSGVSSTKEASLHQDAINELGQSVNLEMSPKVVSFHGQTTKLTGDMSKQFKEWRNFMARMYELEATPDTQL